MRRLATTVAGPTLAAGFYLLLIDTSSPPELYAGAGVVLLALLAVGASRERRSAEPEIDPRWLSRAWRVAIRVPGQIALVSWEAVRQLWHGQPERGSFRAVPFEGGAETRATPDARRSPRRSAR